MKDQRGRPRSLLSLVFVVMALWGLALSAGLLVSGVKADSLSVRPMIEKFNLTEEEGKS